jgi:hypothetical protein
LLKTLIALDRKADESHVILIEEPENPDSSSLHSQYYFATTLAFTVLQ